MQGNVNIPDSTITSALTFRQLVLMNMQQLTNFPYIEKDFDALTDYELLCLVVKFLNDVIANQNEQNDSITSMYEAFLALQTYVNNTKDTLEDAFNNLDNYVRNYFDNLDVQEEINNKLDSMLEDGTLQTIIEEFLQTNALWCFNNVSSMKLATNLINGSFCKTLGYYNANDGGMANYKIRTKTNEDVINEMSLIALYDENLVAELIVQNNVLNIKQYGAKGNNTQDDTDYFKQAIEDYMTIYIPNGTYLISDTLEFAYKTHFIGQDKNNTTIKYTEEESSLTYAIILDDRCIIENLCVLGPYTSETISEYTNYKVSGIKSYNKAYNTIRNCRLFQLYQGIFMGYTWCDNIEDSYFGRCYIGIDSSTSGENNNIYIKSCISQFNDYGMFLGQGRTQTVISCDIEKNRTCGLERQNSGDIQILNTYFEDKIIIYWGQTYVNNVLISGCSFFQNPDTSGSAMYNFIEYNGNTDYTRIIIQNCDFVNGSQDSSNYTFPAIKQTNNAITVRPTLIENNIKNMVEFNPQYFRGNYINKGNLVSYAYSTYGANFINTTAAGTTNLGVNDARYYRISVGESATYTFTLPKPTDDYRELSYRFVIPYSVPDGREGHIAFTGIDSDVYVSGSTTVGIEARSKIITAQYIGQFNSKYQWLITVS